MTQQKCKWGTFPSKRIGAYTFGYILVWSEVGANYNASVKRGVVKAVILKKQQVAFNM